MGRDIKERNIKGVELACKSVVTCEIFDRIIAEGRMPMFIGVVQLCSVERKTIRETIDTLLEHFKGYIEPELLTEDMFKHIISNNIQVAEAWGYGGVGEKVRDIMIKNKAFEIAHNSESLEDIVLYNRLQDGTVNSKEAANTINFNISK